MSLFEGLVGGGLGGMAGAAVAHLGVNLMIRAGWMSMGDALAAVVSLGITLSLTAYGLSRRLKPALIALAGAFLALLAAGKPAVWVAGYAATLWGIIIALGWLLAGRRGALLVPLGAIAGFVLVSALPASRTPGTNPFVPPASELLVTLFTGAGMGAGLYLASRRDHDRTAA